MTSIQNKKLLFATILSVAITAAAIALLVTNTTHEALATEVQPATIQGISMKSVTPDEYVANGGKSAVKIEIPVQHVTLKRGTTTTVDITMTHLAGTNPYPYVIVSMVTPFHEIFYAPALAASTTPDQRLQAMETGQLISGSVDLSTWVSYSETSAMQVKAGEKYDVKMYITVPTDIPTDMIGRDGHIQIPLKVTDNNGNSDAVAWQNGRIDFTVVG